MEYPEHARRGDSAPRRFCEILLEGLAPDGGLYLPERYPRMDAATLAKWRRPPTPTSFEILSLYIDDIAAADLRALVDQDLHRRGCSARRDHAAQSHLATASGCGTVQRPDARLLGHGDAAARQPVRVRTGAPRRAAQHARRDLGDTGSAAEYALRGKRGVNVFMLSPHGRMSPFQQAQMFSLQDANIHNIAIEGVFDDCQDIVKAVSGDLAFKRRHRIGTVNSINWARLLAQVVYYFGLLPRDETERRTGQLHRAVGQLRQHLRRPRGADDGPADPPPRRGDQRERRARRVLPHRNLPRALGGRDARDLEPVDGHLQGVELRALRVRPDGPGRGADARTVRRTAGSRRCVRPRDAERGACRASASPPAAARTPTGWRRSAACSAIGAS